MSDEEDWNCLLESALIGEVDDLNDAAAIRWAADRITELERENKSKDAEIARKDGEIRTRHLKYKRDLNAYADRAARSEEYKASLKCDIARKDALLREAVEELDADDGSGYSGLCADHKFYNIQAQVKELANRIRKELPDGD
ncbi:MAG TPA: hypothetical protein VKP88_07685 [Candidatus Paceibacterota bacterium]|nr:hypothetical protein [Candidatus Paceibacterota bacterium]